MVNKARRDDLHRQIVSKVLPHFAERLKSEGVISDSNRRPFIIRLSEDWPPVKIVPDLVLCLPDKKKVLVEVANPKDPKRFMGEIVYSHLLGYYKEISAATIFVLHPNKYEKTHSRGVIQKLTSSQILKKQMPSIVVSWSKNQDVVYKNLRLMLAQQFAFFRF
jgi:hypothetical protein